MSDSKGHGIVATLTLDVVNALIERAYAENLWKPTAAGVPEIFEAGAKGWPVLEQYTKASLVLKDVGLRVVVGVPTIIDQPDGSLQLHAPIAIQSLIRPWQFWDAFCRAGISLPPPTSVGSGAGGAVPDSVDVDKLLSGIKLTELKEMLYVSLFDPGTYVGLDEVFLNGAAGLSTPASVTNSGMWDGVDVEFWKLWKNVVAANTKAKGVLIDGRNKIRLSILEQFNATWQAILAKYTTSYWLDRIVKLFKDKFPTEGTLLPGIPLSESVADAIVTGAKSHIVIVGAGIEVTPLPSSDGKFGLTCWFDISAVNTLIFDVKNALEPLGDVAISKGPNVSATVGAGAMVLQSNDNFGLAIGAQALRAVFSLLFNILKTIGNQPYKLSSEWTCDSWRYLTAKLMKEKLYVVMAYEKCGKLGGDIGASKPIRIVVEPRLPGIEAGSPWSVQEPTFGLKTLRLYLEKEITNGSSATIFTSIFVGVPKAIWGFFFEDDDVLVGPPLPPKEPGRRLLLENQYVTPNFASVSSQDIQLGFKVHTNAVRISKGKVQWPPKVSTVPVDFRLLAEQLATFKGNVVGGPDGPIPAQVVLTNTNWSAEAKLELISPGNLAVLSVRWKLFAIVREWKSEGIRARALHYTPVGKSESKISGVLSFGEWHEESEAPWSQLVSIPVENAELLVVEMHVGWDVTNRLVLALDGQNFITKSLTVEEVSQLKTIFGDLPSAVTSGNRMRVWLNVWVLKEDGT